MRYRWFAHEDEKDEFDQPVSRALWHDEDREEHPKVIFSVGKGAGTFLAGMVVCYAIWAGGSLSGCFFDDIIVKK